jgi:hypothetical protein
METLTMITDYSITFSTLLLSLGWWSRNSPKRKGVAGMSTLPGKKIAELVRNSNLVIEPFESRLIQPAS